jgi:hypothetical protein
MSVGAPEPAAVPAPASPQVLAPPPTRTPGPAERPRPSRALPLAIVLSLFALSVWALWPAGSAGPTELASQPPASESPPLPPRSRQSAPPLPRSEPVATPDEAAPALPPDPAPGKRPSRPRGPVPAEPPPLAPAPAILSINTDPWSEVSLDGQPIGSTPIWRRHVSPGEHTLVLRNPVSGVEKRLTVALDPGQERTVSLPLR